MEGHAEQSKEQGKEQKETEGVEEEVQEEEYVLLDLDDVCVGSDILANIPYHLSGLDTLTPILTLGRQKLIGEYQETIGTCYLFSEKGDASMKLPSENLPSEVLEKKNSTDSNQQPSQDIKPITSLHKQNSDYKFRESDQQKQNPLSLSLRAASIILARPLFLMRFHALIMGITQFLDHLRHSRHRFVDSYCCKAIVSRRRLQWQRRVSLISDTMTYSAVLRLLFAMAVWCIAYTAAAILLCVRFVQF